MGAFIVRRAAAAIALLFAISVLTFLIFFAFPSSDPALRLAGRTATPAQIAAVRKTWGFNKPIYVQYFKTMEKIFDGSIISYTQQLNVDNQIASDLQPTVSLAVGAGIIWFLFGVLFGVLSAVRAGRWLDRLLTIFSMVGVSTPVFFLGAVLLYYLGFKAGIFPNGDYVSITTDPIQWLYHMILPWLTLSALFIGVYSRVLRSTILDMLNDDFVRTARAKGLSERQVMVRHVLRNSLIPIVSLWGLDFASVIGGGAILTETVFNLQGVGQYAATSITNLDVPPVLVITMYGAFFVVLLGAIVDIVHASLDPRVRLSA
ncbi:MAG TPA: ABC transporter permease [Solirubrobacteraceae bacterium]|nr:ABC transporter permease [Solirubrobacteraceae bacterium]